jgi:hypothetical protein
MRIWGFETVMYKKKGVYGENGRGGVGILSPSLDR